MIIFLSLSNETLRNRSPFHANGAYFLVMNSKTCTCPNLLFNLLSVFWVSPERIPETPAFWVRVYPKRYDIGRLSETWSFRVASNNTFEGYG